MALTLIAQTHFTKILLVLYNKTIVDYCVIVSVVIFKFVYGINMF